MHTDNDNENDEFVGTFPASVVFKSVTDDALLLLLLLLQQIALAFGNIGDKNTCEHSIRVGSRNQ